MRVCVFSCTWIVVTVFRVSVLRSVVFLPFLLVGLMARATSDEYTPSRSELLLSQQLVSVILVCLQYRQNFLN